MAQYKPNDQNWDLALSHYNGRTLHNIAGRFIRHLGSEKQVSSVKRWWDRAEWPSLHWAMVRPASWILDDTPLPAPRVIWQDGPLRQITMLLFVTIVRDQRTG